MAIRLITSFTCTILSPLSRCRIDWLVTSRHLVWSIEEIIELLLFSNVCLDTAYDPLTLPLRREEPDERSITSTYTYWSTQRDMEEWKCIEKNCWHQRRFSSLWRLKGFLIIWLFCLRSIQTRRSNAERDRERERDREQRTSLIKPLR